MVESVRRTEGSEALPIHLQSSFTADRLSLPGKRVSWPMSRLKGKDSEFHRCAARGEVTGFYGRLPGLFFRFYFWISLDSPVC